MVGFAAVGGGGGGSGGGVVAVSVFSLLLVLVLVLLFTQFDSILRISCSSRQCRSGTSFNVSKPKPCTATHRFDPRSNHEFGPELEFF